MKKAIVTGGAGFIGSHIVDALLERGFDVHAVDDLSSGKKERVNKSATLHTVDIRNLDALQKIIDGAAYVFHTAALPRIQFSIEHPVETNEVNVDGTLNVLIAAQKANVKKVIYSASSSAYGDQQKLPLFEDMPAQPKSPYGLQKYIGELYCKMWSEVYGLPTVSLRYFNVYGPRLDPDGDYALVIGKFLKQRKAGKPITITGDGEQTRDFTHVRDVVRANILAAETDHVGAGEVLNIGAGEDVSINTLAKLIGGSTVHVEPRLETRYTRADTSKAKEALGWQPEISFEEGVAELKEIFGIV